MRYFENLIYFKSKFLSICFAIKNAVAHGWSDTLCVGEGVG